MKIKFYKCNECGRDNIVLASDYPSPFCIFCMGKDIVETEPHSVWHNPWLYLSKEYSVKGKTFESLYLWSGLLVKWPVVIQAVNWVGNLAGVTLGTGLPNGHCYKIFNRKIHQDMVDRGWWKTVPNWTR
jgi:hypothetical protein